jgi:diguanylate cyclase (GGDEF)-like protein
VSARLRAECHLRLAGLALWLILATTLVTGVTTGSDWPVTVGALVIATVAALLVPSARLGISIGLGSGLFTVAWLLLDGNMVITALGIGSCVCLSGLAAIAASCTQIPAAAGAADQRAQPAATAHRLPPGVADGALFERLIVHELTRARRYERPLTCLLVGIEDWSAICVKGGRHSAHDRLGVLAMRIRRLLRDVDAIGEYGEGRLAMVLPETPLDGALVVATRIERVALDEVGLRVRLGASIFPDDAVTVEGLFREAEAALDLAHLEQVTIAERVHLI